MANKRCFDTNLNSINQSAGDYTKIKKQGVMYNELKFNVKKFGTVNPTKKNGYLYNANFCATNPTAKINNSCLKYAKNAELLLDITKGRRYINPLLGPAAVPIYNAWSGAFLVQDYQPAGVPHMTTGPFQNTTYFLEAEKAQLLYGIDYPEQVTIGG